MVNSRRGWHSKLRKAKDINVLSLSDHTDFQLWSTTKRTETVVSPQQQDTSKLNCPRSYLWYRAGFGTRQLLEQQRDPFWGLMWPWRHCRSTSVTTGQQASPPSRRYTRKKLEERRSWRQSGEGRGPPLLPDDSEWAWNHLPTHQTFFFLWNFTVLDQVWCFYWARGSHDLTLSVIFPLDLWYYLPHMARSMSIYTCVLHTKLFTGRSHDQDIT